MHRNHPQPQPQPKPTPPRTINLSGNIKKNIASLLQSLQCCQNCEFEQILFIFAQKIERLRAERDAVKGRYVDDVYGLRLRVRGLEEENRRLRERLEDYGEQEEGEREEGTEREYLKISCQDIDIKPEDPNPSSKQPQQLPDYQTIKKMSIKYNLSGQQLQAMLKQYLNIESDLNKMGAPSKEQKRLLNLQEALEKEREKREIGDGLAAELRGLRAMKGNKDKENIR